MKLFRADGAGSFDIDRAVRLKGGRFDALALPQRTRKHGAPILMGICETADPSAARLSTPASKTAVVVFARRISVISLRD